jgi:hypothetical protein
VTVFSRIEGLAVSKFPAKAAMLISMALQFSPAIASSQLTQPIGSMRSGPIAQVQNIPPSDVPERRQVNVAYDPKTNLYCVTSRYKDGYAIREPACRAADEWNRSGLLGVKLRTQTSTAQ